jgi:trigger factor
LENAESKALENQPAGTQAGATSGEPPVEAGHETGGHDVHEPGDEHGHEHQHEGPMGHTHAGPPPMDPACRREVEVEIPAEVVNKQQDAIVQQYSKQARVPGFRKGKVPASVVRNRFNSEITSELVESLVPQYFREAVLKAGHRPVSQPSIYALEFTPGEPMRFKAAFEVLPEFELGSYDEIKVEKPELKVTDEEVDSEIKQLQERQASFDPVNEERGAEKGEFVQVSFEAMPKGAEEKPESVEAATAEQKPEGEAETKPVQMDDVLVEIGGANTIPEFTEHLSGAKAGEDRNFEVSYPEDFYDKRLAGLTFNYKVKVNAIKKKSLPELNDDFAKELSQEFQTLDELKARIRENMEMQRKHQAEHQAKEQLIEQLVARHDFPVPRSLVEHQIDLRLERGLRALAAQGMKTEDMRRMDFGRLRAGQHDAAVKEVKSNVLLAKIAIKENIRVSDEELEKEIAAMAQQMQQPVDEVKKRLVQDNAVDRLRDRMRSEKALNFLYERAG